MNRQVKSSAFILFLVLTLTPSHLQRGTVCCDGTRTRPQRPTFSGRNNPWSSTRRQTEQGPHRWTPGSRPKRALHKDQRNGTEASNPNNFPSMNACHPPPCERKYKQMICWTSQLVLKSRTPKNSSKPGLKPSFLYKLKV